MANLKIIYHFEFADANGNLSTTRIVDVTPDTTVVSDIEAQSSALAAALTPMSNAKLVNRSASIQIDRAQGIGTDAEFPLNSQKALLTFTNAFGSRQAVGVPAAKEVIFLPPPGDAQVDMTNGLVAAFHTVVTAQIKDAGGNPLNLLTSGVLVDRRITKRAPRRTATA